MVVAVVLLWPDSSPKQVDAEEVACEPGILDQAPGLVQDVLNHEACVIEGEPYTLSLYYDGEWRTMDAVQTPLLEPGATSVNAGAERTVTFRHYSDTTLVQEWSIKVGEQALVKVTYLATQGSDRIEYEGNAWAEP